MPKIVVEEVLFYALQEVAKAARGLKNYDGDHRQEETQWCHLWYTLDDAISKLDGNKNEYLKIWEKHVDKALIARLVKLEEALRFYADEKNWSPVVAQNAARAGDALFDRGAKAREALNE